MDASKVETHTFVPASEPVFDAKQAADTLLAAAKERDHLLAVLKRSMILLDEAALWCLDSDGKNARKAARDMADGAAEIRNVLGWPTS